MTFIVVAVCAARAERFEGGKAALLADGGIEEFGLIRWGCMSGQDVNFIGERLVKGGLRPPSDPDPDFTVVDMFAGPYARPSWLKVERGPRGYEISAEGPTDPLPEDG